MLRGGSKQQQQAVSRTWNLLVFSVGGKRLAVKTEEVLDIVKWGGGIPVTTHTPFVSAIVRRDQAVLPVFNLADLLHVEVHGSHLLCLTVKHPLGNMAICIDEDMPVLETLDLSAIQTYAGQDIPTNESYRSGFDEIPILSMAQLAMG
jgi:chemotaxis signal transduction protein